MVPQHRHRLALVTGDDQGTGGGGTGTDSSGDTTADHAERRLVLASELPCISRLMRTTKFRLYLPLASELLGVTRVLRLAVPWFRMKFLC